MPRKSSKPDGGKTVHKQQLVNSDGRKHRHTQPRGKDIDWLIVREHFVCNVDETLGDIATYYGISKWTLFTRAKDEGWKELREQFTAQAVTLARESALQRIAKEVPQRYTELLHLIGDLTTTYLENKLRLLKAGELEAESDAATQGEKQDSAWRQRTITKRQPLTEKQHGRLLDLYARMLAVPLGSDLGIGLPYDSGSRTAAGLWGNESMAVDFVQAPEGGELPTLIHAEEKQEEIENG